METLVRVGTFLGVLTVMLLWEGSRPRRSLSRPRQERWVTNRAPFAGARAVSRQGRDAA